MYILNIAKAMKKMSVIEVRDFIFENYNKRIGFLRKEVFIQWNTWKKKDLLLLANKLIEKIPDPPNAKEHYQWFIRKKNKKSIKQSEIITYQLKTFENPNTVDTKSVITCNPKNSHTLSKTEKVGSNSSSYSDTKKEKKFKQK